MCISFKNKWTDFIPSAKYLQVVKLLTSVDKLYQFIQQFKRKEDIKDYWQTPEETLNRLTYDCDDSMRFCVDVLKRVMGIEARGLIHSGYDKSRWKGIRHHAICAFPYQGKFGVFSNKQLYTDIDSFEDAGKIMFPDGLKYQEIRDWQGKILSKKRKWIGKF